MGLSLEDLQPKTFTINVRGHELTCHPLRLSHALVVAKIGNVFQDKTASKQAIKQAEVDMDEVIAELIPELDGIKLDMAATMEVIEQMMQTIEPEDNKELTDAGVKFDADPKAKTIG